MCVCLCVCVCVCVCVRNTFCVCALLGMQESTSAHPRLHSVWPLVIDLVKKKDKDFGDFWATVVEGKC